MTKDKLIIKGKSKDVYEIAEGKYKGKYRMVFKDDATGYMENGKPVFDPGADVVVGQIPGKGAIACRFATHFFKLLQQHNIPSHYIDTISENEMIVEPAEPLGMDAQSPEFPGAEALQNLEFTWRNNATGSFWRRYPFVQPCKNLNRVVEAWTKGDVDVLICSEPLLETEAMTRTELEHTIKLVQDIADIVTKEFATKGLHVLDGKFELGRLKHGDGKIVIIDEISPDVLRVCDGYTPDEHGNCKIYKECTVTNFANGKRTIKNKCQVKGEEFISVFF